MVRSIDFGDKPTLNPEFAMVESNRDPTSVGSSKKRLYWFTEEEEVHQIDCSN